MAEEVVAYVAAAVFDAGYYEAGLALSTYGTVALEIAATATTVYSARESQRRVPSEQPATVTTPPAR